MLGKYRRQPLDREKVLYSDSRSDRPLLTKTCGNQLDGHSPFTFCTDSRAADALDAISGLCEG